MSLADQVTIRSLVGRLPDPVLEPGRTALVVIDLQRLDADADGAHGVRAREMGMWDELEGYFTRCADVVVPATRRVADALRTAGGMIVWVRCEARKPDASDTGRRFRAFDILVPPGDPQAALLEGLGDQPEDLILGKTTASPFFSTDLAEQLQARGIRNLLVCGVVTSGCVESTIRDACDLDFDVVLVEDACADRRPEAHADCVRRMDGNFAVAWSADTTLARLSPTPPETA